MTLSPRSFEYRYRLWILFGSKPVLAVGVAVVTGSLAGWYSPAFTTSQAVIGTALASLGLLIRLWSSSVMNASVIASLHPDARQLVTQGPYSVSRNPLYIGTLCMFAGYACFFSYSAMAVFIAFHLFRYQRIIRIEENALSEEWGLQFDQFVASTSRWLPTRPRALTGIFSGGMKISAEAVVLNALFTGMWLGCAAGLLTGSLVPLIPIELVGGVISALAHWHRQRVTAFNEASPQIISNLAGETLEISSRNVA